MKKNTILLAVVCITYTGMAQTDPSDTLFDTSRIIEVDIQMSTSDWDFIRTQKSKAKEAFAQTPDRPPVSGYEYRSATVTVDGIVLENVGVRKKGTSGSLSEDRPSLKIKFDEYVTGQEVYNRERLTLNNCIQDASYMRQGLANGLFIKAGLPASRCNFAHVTVNGQDKGLYANVESIKKRFLARHFADNDGQLFEGPADFIVGWTGHFQPKINSMDPDIRRLCYMMDALDAPDGTMISLLPAYVDIEQFMKYWAMEVLIGNSDCYSGNANNFFIYRDPTSDLFNFIPWGPDLAFTDEAVVYGRGKLSYRLYQIPSMQEKYVSAARDLLLSVWDEAELTAEIDRMEALIESMVSNDPGFDKDVQQLRQYITNRRDRIEPALDNPPSLSDGPWDEKCLNNYTCMDITSSKVIHNKSGRKVDFIRTNSYIKIRNRNAEQLDYKITTVNGRVILWGMTRQRDLKLDIRTFSKGMYLLFVEGEGFNRIFKFENIINRYAK